MKSNKSFFISYIKYINNYLTWKKTITCFAINFLFYWVFFYSSYVEDSLLQETFKNETVNIYFLRYQIFFVNWYWYS